MKQDNEYDKEEIEFNKKIADSLVQKDDELIKKKLDLTQTHNELIKKNLEQKRIQNELLKQMNAIKVSLDVYKLTITFYFILHIFFQKFSFLILLNFYNYNSKILNLFYF